MITAREYVQSPQSTHQMGLWLQETNHPLSNHLFTTGAILPLKTKQVSKSIPMEASLEGSLSWCSFELKEEMGIVQPLCPFCTDFRGGGGRFFSA